MAKSARKPTPIPLNHNQPDDGLATQLVEFCELREWYDTQARAKVKRMEFLKVALRDRWLKDRPPQPWNPPGWLVFFDERNGKSKSVCGRGDCGNLGQFHAPEYHVKTQALRSVA